MARSNTTPWTRGYVPSRKQLIKETLASERAKDKVMSEAHKRAQQARNPVKANGLPSGSGFDRLVGKRADINNMPGKQNHFGDRVVSRSPTLNTRVGNPRQGQEYQTSYKGNREVHTYTYGGHTNRVVLAPKKRKPIVRY